MRMGVSAAPYFVWCLASGCLLLACVLLWSVLLWRKGERGSLHLGLMMSMIVGALLGGVGWVLFGAAGTQKSLDMKLLLFASSHLFIATGLAAFIIGKALILTRAREIMKPARTRLRKYVFLIGALVVCLPWIAANIVLTVIDNRTLSMQHSGSCDTITFKGCSPAEVAALERTFQVVGFGRLYESLMLILATVCYVLVAVSFVKMVRHMNATHVKRRVALCVVVVATCFLLRACVDTVYAVGVIGKGNSGDTLSATSSIVEDLQNNQPWVLVLPQILSECLAGTVAIWGIALSRGPDGRSKGQRLHALRSREGSAAFEMNEST